MSKGAVMSRRWSIPLTATAILAAVLLVANIPSTGADLSDSRVGHVSVTFDIPEQAEATPTAPPDEDRAVEEPSESVPVAPVENDEAAQTAQPDNEEVTSEPQP